MDTNDAPRTGALPIEPGEKDEVGAPVTQAEAGRRPSGLPDQVDSVTQPDSAGMSGGASGGSGGGSTLPGHPDAAR
jgi:hypothetical protein